MNWETPRMRTAYTLTRAAALAGSAIMRRTLGRRCLLLVRLDQFAVAAAPPTTRSPSRITAAEAPCDADFLRASGLSCHSVLRSPPGWPTTSGGSLCSTAKVTTPRPVRVMKRLCLKRPHVSSHQLRTCRRKCLPPVCARSGLMHRSKIGEARSTRVSISLRSVLKSDCFCQFRRALDGSRWRRSDHCVTATITIKVGL
jgi:hypothetical protein